jgi:hypothetical protein
LLFTDLDPISWVEKGPLVDIYSSGTYHQPSIFGLASVPPSGAYCIPRREVEEEDDLIVMRYRENKARFLFRQDGFKMRNEMYRLEHRVEALNYLWEWRLANSHIPESFLINGTYGHKVPYDALLSAVVEDVSLGDPGDENYVFG